MKQIKQQENDVKSHSKKQTMEDFNWNDENEEQIKKKIRKKVKWKRWIEHWQAYIWQHTKNTTR